MRLLAWAPVQADWRPSGKSKCEHMGTGLCTEGWPREEAARGAVCELRGEASGESPQAGTLISILQNCEKQIPLVTRLWSLVAAAAANS